MTWVLVAGFVLLMASWALGVVPGWVVVLLLVAFAAGFAYGGGMWEIPGFRWELK
ncbi:hypothetical protein SEQ_HALENA_54 [Mycobacterium phage Halena]|uniref:Uncharacterized protein n=6 Tax=Bronvirus TaxID=1623278 RepID=A0A5Q2WE67_9CAUD|nr:hypothetical protein KNU85_gp053 [Mycobacterium phage DirkDirk]AEK07589.1 hypothetical protein UPIE_55 [Mycobacterium phage UPIE]AEZ50732.1 hypothetical protein [Mycobacterium phage Fezzik]AYD82234.1 hypothetical protein SEA_WAMBURGRXPRESS_55 [Mycobacterium phage Wamburgrxpress]QBP29838.1 hypothetical protein SEQ_HALENA_54 [Mycobacterium phage Halena]QGJ92461.1 hypothetical protein SEA_WYATT2_57 [Mycobacterium phage Wyatt2]QWT30584.1 membrane protein [Mycobacterium phage Rose5]UEM46340.1 